MLERLEAYRESTREFDAAPTFQKMDRARLALQAADALLEEMVFQISQLQDCVEALRKQNGK